MNDVSRYYRDSGVVPMSGTMIMLFGGTAAAAIFGLVYALVDYYNPLLYINFLATSILGVMVGLVVHQCGRKGNVRNRMTRRLAALAIGGVTVVFTWIWFVWIVTEYRFLIFDPEGLWALIQLIAANGLWEIKGFEPKGGVLYTVWGIEAAIIVGIAYQTGVGDEDPYCEACGRWTESDGQTLWLAKTDADQLRTTLEEERYEILGELFRADVDPQDCLHATWHTCSECSESNYLTLTHTRVTPQKDGKESIHSTTLIRQLSVPQWLIEQLSAEVARLQVELDKALEEEAAGAAPTEAGHQAESAESGEEALPTADAKAAE